MTVITSTDSNLSFLLKFQTFQAELLNSRQNPIGARERESVSIEHCEQREGEGAAISLVFSEAPHAGYLSCEDGNIAAKSLQESLCFLFALSCVVYSLGRREKG